MRASSHKLSLAQSQRQPHKDTLRVLLASLIHIIKNPIPLPYPRTSSRAIPIYCVAVNGLRGGTPKTGPVEWVDNTYCFYAPPILSNPAPRSLKMSLISPLSQFLIPISPLQPPIPGRPISVSHLLRLCTPAINYSWHAGTPELSPMCSNSTFFRRERWTHPTTILPNFGGGIVPSRCKISLSLWLRFSRS